MEPFWQKIQTTWTIHSNIGRSSYSQCCTEYGQKSDSLNSNLGSKRGVLQPCSRAPVMMEPKTPGGSLRYSSRRRP